MNWMSSLRVELDSVSSILLCSYFRMALKRGKSVPSRVRCALVWCEDHLKVGLGVKGVEIRSFVLKLVVVTPDGKSVKSKHQAPALPVDSVIALEDLVSSAHTLPLRVYAGLACLCVHGVKRWSDAQHVGDVGSTEDAI